MPIDLPEGGSVGASIAPVEQERPIVNQVSVDHQGAVVFGLRTRIESDNSVHDLLEFA